MQLASLRPLTQKFWELEEVPETKSLTRNDLILEELFWKIACRRGDGRYDGYATFPDSVSWGHSRTKPGETPEIQKIYSKVLEELLTLDHREQINSLEIIRKGKYFSFYLPHNTVIQSDSKTTKV